MVIILQMVFKDFEYTVRKLPLLRVEVTGGSEHSHCFVMHSSMMMDEVFIALFSISTLFVTHAV